VFRHAANFSDRKQMLPQNWIVVGVGGLALLLGGIANFEVFGLLALFLYSLILITMIYFIVYHVGCLVSGGCRFSSWSTALAGCLGLGSLGLFNYYALTKKVQLPGLADQQIFAVNPIFKEGIDLVQEKTGMNVFKYIHPKSGSMD
jgi:hypothetical protein